MAESGLTASEEISRKTFGHPNVCYGWQADIASDALGTPLLPNLHVSFIQRVIAFGTVTIRREVDDAERGSLAIIASNMPHEFDTILPVQRRIVDQGIGSMKDGGLQRVIRAGRPLKDKLAQPLIGDRARVGWLAQLIQDTKGGIEGNCPSLADKRRCESIRLGKTSVEGGHERYLGLRIVKYHRCRFAANGTVRNGSKAAGRFPAVQGGRKTPLARWSGLVAAAVEAL